VKRYLISFVLTFVISALSAHAQVSKSISNDDEQQAICSFITTHISSVVSQVPTLCSAVRDEASKYEKAQYFNINIFASGNVLRGPMRRAWISALFQALEGVAQDTPLQKACSGDNVCLLSFADTQMSEHNLHYESYLRSSDVDALESMLKTNKSSEFSELWYELWWNSVFKVSTYPKSKENANSLGEDACKSFSDAVIKRSKEFGMDAPSCSVLIANSDNIYIVVDFNDFMKALTGRMMADDLLPNTIASRLNNTGYGGQVIVRSPWFKTVDGNERIYRVYRLQDLEFAYDEEQSGLRNESDIYMLLAMRYESNGVISQNHLVADPKIDSAIRPVAVASMTRSADGSQIVDTTDGAAWRVSAKSTADCDLHVGMELFLAAAGDADISLTTDHKGKTCRLEASFVMGW
jgi:hypothetical protein